MDFSDFEKRLSKLQKLPLPGEKAQMEMAPMARIRELKAMVEVRKTARVAAVLALFYPSKDGRTHFALILRKQYKGVHSAQVGFPGGKREPQDHTYAATALRETEEEVGLPRSKVQIVRELTEVFIPPSNFIVRPFLGVTGHCPTFVPEEAEVERVIEVPLSEFLDDRALVQQRLSTSYATDILVPAYKLQQHTVWGATAMMLSELRQLLRQID